MNNTPNDKEFTRSKSELTPVSACCGVLLLAKIGTEISVCPNCDREFQIISVDKIERGISHARINMDTVPTKREREYWIGFTGGIRWTRQQERYE